MRNYWYARMDIAPAGYSSLATHISDVNPPVFILKQSGHQVYYVVDDYAWWAAYDNLSNLSGSAISTDEMAELALHQTAERFDTLEQAMLYFAATT